MLLSIAAAENSYAQFMTVLLIFVFVLLITYLATRWIAGYQKERSGGGNIQIVESFRLTTGKYIQIVKVGEKYLAIAVCKDTVEMLSEIPEEQLKTAEGEKTALPGFKEIFDRVKGSGISGKTEAPREKE